MVVRCGVLVYMVHQLGRIHDDVVGMVLVGMVRYLMMIQCIVHDRQRVCTVKGS